MIPENAIVIKFGGSVCTSEDGINPDYFDSFFLQFRDILMEYSYVVCVIGGGPRARMLQSQATTNQEKDRVGIKATQEHAAQLRDIMRDHELQVHPTIASNPQQAHTLFNKLQPQFYCVGGLEVGQSTDAVAVTIARYLMDQQIETSLLFLSNVSAVFTQDPMHNPEAPAIKEASVHDLIERQILIDDPAAFVPGMNIILDPVACHLLDTTVENITSFLISALSFSEIRKFLSRQTPNQGTLLFSHGTKFELHSAGTIQ